MTVKPGELHTFYGNQAWMLGRRLTHGRCRDGSHSLIFPGDEADIRMVGKQELVLVVGTIINTENTENTGFNVFTVVYVLVVLAGETSTWWVNELSLFPKLRGC